QGRCGRGMRSNAGDSGIGCKRHLARISGEPFHCIYDVRRRVRDDSSVPGGHLWTRKCRSYPWSTAHGVECCCGGRPGYHYRAVESGGSRIGRRREQNARLRHTATSVGRVACHWIRTYASCASLETECEVSRPFPLGEVGAKRRVRVAGLVES